jgi:phosphotransferase system HPr (HPr) family protein
MSEKKSALPPITQELWVENRLGLHARPAMKITNLAQQFKADLVLEKDGVPVNARDLLAILTLDCPQGTRLVLKATGPEATEAVLSVCRLFARKFDES